VQHIVTREELKADITELRNGLKSDINELKTDMTELRGELKMDIKALRDELIPITINTHSNNAHLREHKL